MLKLALALCFVILVAAQYPRECRDVEMDVARDAEPDIYDKEASTSLSILMAVGKGLRTKALSFALFCHVDSLGS